ncbi:hypothetical protein R4227_16030 [Gordonia amicalis]|uniref:hypothetical protein n=1 Tax=Gordonia amicalis TaxID=89053 RepID=UPI002953B18A|nr:hypothetical protein [Gordonia amicalis]MDV7101584.1 hypothetical protein [Gordonia amicalis]
MRRGAGRHRHVCDRREQRGARGGATSRRSVDLGPRGRRPQARVDRAESVTPRADADDSARSGPGATCGTIPGPDGALRVLILAGDVDCDQAKTIGGEYGPKIVSGTQQSVSGWTCGPSQLQGVLAACQKDTTVIGFAP